MNKSCDTEILSVGTELLLGHVTNTDARDLSELLSKIGVNVRYHTVVGDNPQRLAECVRIARQRADVIITTGGLGPTCDDLTKQILAESFGLKLVENAEERRGLYDSIHPERGFTGNNFSQALLPEGCTVFHNDWGTAPGCAFEKDGKIVVMMPGPPNECLPMFRRYAIPYLKKLSEEQIVSHSVRIFGIGESGVDDMFADEMNAMTNPTMAPYAKECDCLLQITAKAGSEAEAESMMAPVIARVKERLGEYVYGMDIECIEEAVLPLLKERGMTFAAAESCTGGDIARRITEIPGASAVFAGGCVTYTNEIKAKLLGIDPAMIEENGAVSFLVAKEMAERVRILTGADIGVGVTGLAGPDGDGVHEVGTVFVSMAVEGETFVRELHLGTKRTRSFIRRMAGNHVYDMMRRYLTGLKV
ncbi:MAG: competence/damage-inducible protein A [Oscillospiraceae bacterium]|nr:competence/damage-inducible protein A [Oscillospiraceae bacterium]MBQ5405231.1 competence/damage-inducible protein A [Oscillospiraceae bacterium]